MTRLIRSRRPPPPRARGAFFAGVRDGAGRDGAARDGPPWLGAARLGAAGGVPGTDLSHWPTLAGWGAVVLLFLGGALLLAPVWWGAYKVRRQRRARERVPGA